MRQLLAGTLCGVVLSGCPQVLSDDFRVRAQSLDAGQLTANTGGANTQSGAASTSQAGALFTGGTGGATNISASGGTASVGGTLALSSDPCSFGARQQITGLQITSDEWGPTLSSQATVMYFSVHSGTTDSLYRSDRPLTRPAAFSGATPAKISGFTGSVATPFLSDDSLSLYFVSTSAPGNTKDIWVATRATHSDDFSTAHALKVVNSDSADEIRPWLSKDETILLFSTNRTNGGDDFDIWWTTRALDAPEFDPPKRLAVVNDVGRDEAPVMTDDQLTLYFASIRAGGTGQQDIYVATRADPSMDFSLPVPVSTLNTEHIETDLALTYDATELFFVSDPLGVAQIYRAARSCPSSP